MSGYVWDMWAQTASGHQIIETGVEFDELLDSTREMLRDGVTRFHSQRRLRDG